VSSKCRDVNSPDQIEKYLKDLFEQAIKRIDVKSVENVFNILDLDHLSRVVLYLKWLDKFIEREKREMNFDNLELEYNKCVQTIQDLRMQEDRFIMQNASIIAMTTSGASRYHTVLRDIAPRIVIVEEAAEVFEAHVISALSEKCEHLILIGDHVQLRPNPAVFKLAKEYSFDVSLFERLVNNNCSRVMLNTQHRMRPEISCLMLNFYPQEIKDHESVNEFENVRGMHKNVFFMNHPHFEYEDEYNRKTKINVFEAEFCAKFCQYLLKQEYDPRKITLLTFYLGQVHEIKRQLKFLNLAKSKITVVNVDNYQGEENDLVILSCVRSNSEGRIGFLEITNRVCVAMSRAKIGKNFIKKNGL
jgi:superfamily I DNA and/or RNA helicase